MTITPLTHVLRHALASGPAEEAGTDRQMLERFVARRDEGAFAAVVRRHGGLVSGLCRRMLPSAHDAEDAFQATFLVLARRAGSIRKRASLPSWLYGVAYRVARRLRADRARRAACPVRPEDAPGPDTTAEV